MDNFSYAANLILLIILILMEDIYKTKRKSLVLILQYIICIGNKIMPEVREFLV